MCVLNLKYNEAMGFFLQAQSYCTFELPVYFEFSKLILELCNRIVFEDIKKLCAPKQHPKDHDAVNYVLLNNKNGHYAWRPLSLIHPVLYVALAQVITKQDNWKYIIDRIEGIRRNSTVECLSWPTVSQTDQSDKAEQINYWAKNVEKRSIELGLDYEYLFQTDITDCYGAIYTHSIAWALHDKEKAKEQKRDCDLLGNKIDAILQSMSYGQTNGIPQGSVLMDFIAEIVLGYADKLLCDKLKENKILDDYKILRYRDDYRIFVNNPQVGESIIKNLTETLIGLGLRLNDQKTLRSHNVEQDSLKPDKLYWNMHGVKGRVDNVTMLYAINDLSMRFPNCGTIVKLLDKFNKKLRPEKVRQEDITVLISLVVRIAFSNPKTYSITMTVISRLIERMDRESKLKITEKIKRKFEKLPNTELVQLWLQRITIKIDNTIEYPGKLCKRVQRADVEIWKSDWLCSELKKKIDSVDIIDRNKIDELSISIGQNEVALFKSASEY